MPLHYNASPFYSELIASKVNRCIMDAFFMHLIHIYITSHVFVLIHALHEVSMHALFMHLIRMNFYGQLRAFNSAACSPKSFFSQ